MPLMLAAALASAFSFAVFAIIVAWHVAPWLRDRPRSAALIPLLWVHVFRYVALQIFSAHQFGFAVSAGVRDQIAYGDVVGAVLALAAIGALRYRAAIAIKLVWLFAAATIADLVNATIAGVREQLFQAAFGITWLILTFYVPLLWVTVSALVWQLYTRRDESI